MPRGVYVRTEEIRRRQSEAMTGRKLSDEHKMKVSEALKGKYVGPKNANWRGGIRGPRKYQRRNIGFIEIFRSRSHDGLIWCHFCDEEIMKLSGIDGDSLIIHSLDGDHENWESTNKVPTHLACHLRYHNTGERSPHWKGDMASDKAKGMRQSIIF